MNLIYLRGFDLIFLQLAIEAIDNEMFSCTVRRILSGLLRMKKAILRM